jgi:phosphoribosylanthranilate isomerase
MIIKVCGLKFEQNLIDISALDIDMVGYNFYEPSPRYVQNKLPNINSNIKKVGVFVNASESFILQKIKEYNLDYAQLHGDENPEFCTKIKTFIPVIKVFRVKDQLDMNFLNSFDFCDFFLFDTATKQYGGSGKKFDWSLLNEFDIKVPLLLSGGIGPEDLDDILKISHSKFVGIDINSKFEISPGLKDIDKVKFFVDEIKKAS